MKKGTIYKHQYGEGLYIALTNARYDYFRGMSVRTKEVGDHYAEYCTPVTKSSRLLLKLLEIYEV